MFHPDSPVTTAHPNKWDDTSGYLYDDDDDDDETDITEPSSFSSNERHNSSDSHGKDHHRSISRSKSRSSRSNARSIHRSRSGHGLERTRSGQSHGRKKHNNYNNSSSAIANQSLSKSRSKPRSKSGITNGKSTIGSALPSVLLRENTEIEVEHDANDDVSAISSNTLELIASRHEQTMMIRQVNQKLRLQHCHEQSQTKSQVQSNINHHQHHYISSSSGRMNEQYATVQTSFGIDAESTCRSISQMSTGTSEFESCWHPSHKDNHHNNSTTRYEIAPDGNNQNHNNTHLMHTHNSRPHQMVDNYHLSSRRKFESTSARKLRRQIQRDGIGTIKEADLYTDEEEI